MNTNTVWKITNTEIIFYAERNFGDKEEILHRSKADVA